MKCKYRHVDINIQQKTEVMSYWQYFGLNLSDSQTHAHRKEEEKKIPH